MKKSNACGSFRSYILSLCRRLRSTLRGKLILTFTATSAIIFLINIFLFFNINHALDRMIDRVFYTNVQISSLSEALDSIQSGMTEYLSTKSTDSLGQFYEYETEFGNTLSDLAVSGEDAEIQIALANIQNLSESYLSACETTLAAKRGRNVPRYRENYDQATQIYGYLQSYIYSLNNMVLRTSSTSYDLLRAMLRTLELVSMAVLAVITIVNLLITLTFIRQATAPMKDLVAEAGEIGKGNFDVPALKAQSDDELGVVSSAFNEMVVSIRGYVDRLRESMENANRMKERELLMDTHLKEAELKYLQAQINPHFLFNTLNAGAQLSMMEGAERTYRYLQNVAAFFRSKTNREKQVTTLADEIALVDNYIYIINVRFSGSITYEKHVDEDLVNVSIPSMILQPIIENAINHGVRDIDWPALITLSVYRTGSFITISVRDNGRGMSQEQIQAILSGHPPVRGRGDETNGVGLANVVSRLQLFYNQEDVFDVTSAGDGKGSEVLLYIPMPQ